MQLHEQNRPRTLDEVLGQDKAVKIVRGLFERGIGGRSIWISGNSGIGKTTLARIIAAEVAGPMTTIELDAKSLSMPELRDIERKLFTPCIFGPGGTALIVNEAHGLSNAVILRLLVLLESLPDHAVVVFTTTKLGEAALFDGAIDAGPLLSRCVCLSLTNQGLAATLAPLLKSGAERAGLDGKPVSEYVKLMKRPAVKNNIRAAWQAIESGVMA